MDRLLLGLAAPLAAFAVSASPANAQIAAQFGVTASPGPSVSVHRGSGHGDLDGHRRRHRGPTVVVPGGPWVSNEGWALYNNRSWEPDSYNDWWHDRPDRAYPRWMQHNQGCERMWWGGGAWRC